MDIKKLLNQDVINIQVINKALANREALLKDWHLNPTIEWFQTIRSISDPVVIAHYLGDLDSIKKLINVCDGQCLPLFPSDIITIETTHGRVDSFSSDVFFNHMLDGLADIDGMMTSNPNLHFKLLNLKKVKISKEDPREVIEFRKAIDDLDLNIETESIKKHVIKLLNEEFKIFKLNVKTLENIPDILKKLTEINNRTEEHIRLALIPPTKNQLLNYAKTKDILYLVRLIYVFARDGM